MAHQMVKTVFVLDEKDVFNSSFFEEKDWPGVCDMPEYQNMKRLDAYVDGQAVGRLVLTSFLLKISKPPRGMVPVTYPIAARARFTPSAIRVRPRQTIDRKRGARP